MKWCQDKVTKTEKVKVESEKVGLKLNIQKTKIMASGPITSWEVDEETVGTVSDFIFMGSKITAEHFLSSAFFTRPVSLRSHRSSVSSDGSGQQL